ncbi:hypothetical protein WR25_14758 isoform G [Diploscapter pachys]|uniref:Transthyretin-like family protein n=1 Tax=Diploscapter pachys TaxID=2018661 RepID=A0A2A2LC26_9BILA|nr:hypothetical protein WR25_14758 isoform F [Diploscapter pachys]PAV83608.1 hypothetical protein WR25_14758 isoform G [Diploscapter pachys]
MREAWSSLLTWALLLSAVRIVASYEQAVVVKGIINCRGQRMPGMFVQLMEEDSLFDADDLMGSTNADFRGVFCVRGFADEISKIEPFILIEHNCGYEGLNEKARSVYHHYVPSEFIVAGNRSHKIYHLGDIELLAPEAPIREHNRIGMLKPTGVQELDVRMKECIPVYIQYQKTMRLGAKAADASQEVAHVLPQDPAESTTELSDLQPKPTSSPLFSQSAILSASPIQTETRTEQQEVGENKHKYEKEQLEIREKEERQKLEEEEENRRRQEVMDLRRKKEEEERERQLEQETAQKVEAVRIQELKRYSFDLKFLNLENSDWSKKHNEKWKRKNDESSTRRGIELILSFFR